MLELTAHGQERAGGESADRLGQREGGGILVRRLFGGARRRVHELDRAGLVAEDDELHLLLIAHGFDPPRHLDGAGGKGFQLVDQDAFAHDRPSYVRGSRGTRPAAGVMASDGRDGRAERAREGGPLGGNPQEPRTHRA